MQIKLGIIGMGRMGITHFSILNSCPDIDVKAVSDTSSLILNLTKKYITGVNTYDNYNKLFDLESLDAAIICTPPTLHYPIALKAAEKGVHVFCEKPFTTDKNRASELAALFEANNLVNQVGYVNRFNDIFLTVKRYIEKKIIGEVFSFKSEMYSCTITKKENGKTWRGSRENGGGAVFEMASHAIDLVNYIIGKPDKVIGTCLIPIFSHDAEDIVNATFLYKNGISGTLNINWSDESYRKPINKIEIFGSKGKILADQYRIKIYKKTSSDEYNLRKGWNTIYITDVFKSVPFYVRGNEFTSQLYHFIDCVKEIKKNNICSFRNATATLEVIDSIFNDFEQNSNI